MNQDIKDTEVPSAFIKHRIVMMVLMMILTTCKTAPPKEARIQERNLASFGGFSYIQKSRDEFRVGPQSKLFISVTDEPSLTKEVAVQLDGSIDYSFLGKLHVAGMTPKEIEREIMLRLGEYLHFPIVKISVKEFGVIYVLGKVKSPGVIKLEEQYTALQALVQAGGFDASAKRARLQILRNIDGQKKIYDVALKEREDGGVEGVDSFYLLPGDTLVAE